ncbi:hypothetical protein V6N12_046072 [Hibiscus sabdariffa]|uniref:Uncharacterized protein n=1 Tax=Hibiscus sabdariffa TaxID=183260 RepID=A0ABR2G4I0_9ROSI
MVSLVEDTIVEVSARNVVTKTENDAIVTVKDGHNVSKVSLRSREGSSLSKQHVKVNKSLHFKQTMGVRSLPCVTLTDWLMGVSSMIDDEAQWMQHGLERNHEVIDNDDPKGTNLEVDMAKREVMVVTEVVDTVGSVVDP